MKNHIREFPSWPSFNKNQIEKVASILRSGKVNYLTGSEGKNFEKEFAAYCETNYAIALANGTVALTAAYEAIGIFPGDEIIMTPRTFIATASSAVLLGAKPVFADIEEDSGCLDVNSVEKLISSKTKFILLILLERSFHAGFSPSEFFFAIQIAPNSSSSIFSPQTSERFFHILVLIIAIIDASGSAFADLTIPECLDDSAAHKTAFSTRQTFS